MENLKSDNLKLVPVDKPVELQKNNLNAELIETNSFIRAVEARNRYKVTGAKLTAAVLDSGLRTTHVDFAGKVKAQANFTADNNGDAANARDGHGHGTNVSGIIAANGINKGIAPGASIVPVKVLTNTGGGSFQSIDKGLAWVLKNHQALNISVVNLSLGDDGNYTMDSVFSTDSIAAKITLLTQKNIAVVISAGNGFFNHNSMQGMSYPGIIRNCISVGALYDATGNGFSYNSGAVSYTTVAGQITPFSQRLHDSIGSICRTDIFAPGAPITSSGYTADNAFSVQQGTSQAAPVVAGVILLMQELYQKLLPTTKSNLPVLPPVKLLVEWLRNGAVTISDGDDENDNVANTNLQYKRVDAYEALRQVRKYFVNNLAFSHV